MNQPQHNRNNYSCNICYTKPGMYLAQCTCFYCRDCLKEINFEKPECKVCKKTFDIKKTLDMSKPDHVKNVEFIFDNYENQIKRTIECYKFQNLQSKKYIKYLEECRDNYRIEKQALLKKIESLESQLKMFSTSSSNKNLKSSVGKLNDSSYSSENHSNNFIDIKSIKSIVPKRNNSMTNSSKIDKNNYNMKVENLNIRTAENMKIPNINNFSIKTNEGYCTPKPIVQLSNYYEQQNQNTCLNSKNDQSNKRDGNIYKNNNNYENNYNNKRRKFEQANLSNNIGAIYEYEETANRYANKRPKYY